MPSQLTTDERLDRIDARFDEMNKQFDRVAVVVVKGFDRIDKALETKPTSPISIVFDLLDKIAKKQEIDEDERLVMGHQLERLDCWVHEVAKKIGYELAV